MDRSRLVFAIELCAWRQLDYVAGSPQIVAGALVFTGVRNLHLEAPDPGVLTRGWWGPNGGGFLQADRTERGYRLHFEAEGQGLVFCTLSLDCDRCYFDRPVSPISG